jgi:hypothetical protein
MEKKYNNSKIYRLIGTDGYYYIDSTTSELRFRFNNHKQLAKKHPERFEYKHINTVGWDKYKIELIEEYSCNNIKELNERVSVLIEESKNNIYCLNHKQNERNIIENIYNNGKIYKLKSTDGHYYIGSTITSLHKRFSCHKHIITHKKGKGKYKYFETIPITDINIELIESYSCNSKKELLERENYYIKININDILCLNTYHTIHDKQTYKQKYNKENKELISERKKKYYEEHKQETLEYQQQYREANKEKIQEYFVNYRQEHAEKRREYSKKYVGKNKENVKEARRKRYETNKEKELQQHKLYNQNNQEKVNQYKKEWAQKYKETHTEEIAKEREQKRAIREEKKQTRITHDRTIISCDCGGSYQNYQKKRHMESKKHQHFMETQ